jgi:anaerobic dimethyl sulfoxide reductase subunit A
MVPVGALPSGPHAAARRISAVTWADELLGGRLDPPVRMVYVVAGNLINRSPNTSVNAQALAALDFVVVQDPFLTPTARCADLVLPICTDLERADLVTAWGHDSHLFYSRPAAAPLGEARTDYWVFAQLAERLGLGEAYTRGRSAEAWVEHLLATTTPDPGALRREGVLRQDGTPRVALEAFRADPAAHPLPTPSGRIELCNPQADDCGLPAVPAYVPDADGSMGAYPLRLITPHSKLRTHSVGHPNDWLQRLERHAVWIHPLDAEARGIVDEDLVEVRSAVGRVVLPAYVTPRVMPGVVSVYEGAWYRPDGAGVDRGGCANVLTRHRTSPTGGLATHSARVEVRRWV